MTDHTLTLAQVDHLMATLKAGPAPLLVIEDGPRRHRVGLYDARLLIQALAWVSPGWSWRPILAGGRVVGWEPFHIEEEEK